MTLKNQPTIWPVPYACAQPYHQGSGYALLMRLNKAETAAHGCHCPSDMAVCMRKVQARPCLDFQSNQDKELLQFLSRFCNGLLPEIFTSLFLILSFVLVFIKKIYQTLKTVSHHISKHNKVRQKYSAKHRILNSLSEVWLCD